MSIVTPDSITPLYVLPKTTSADTLGRALFAEQLGRMMSDGLLKPNENNTRDRTEQIATESIREHNVSNQKTASKSATDNLLQERQNTKNANQDLTNKNVERQQRTEQKTQTRLTKNQTEVNDNRTQTNVNENRLAEFSPISNTINSETNSVLPINYEPLEPLQTTLANSVNNATLAQNAQTQPTAINPLSQAQTMQAVVIPQPTIIPNQQPTQLPQASQQSIAITIFSANGKLKEDEEKSDDNDTIEKESEQKSKKKTKKVGLFSELLQATLPPQTERIRSRQPNQRSNNEEQVIQTNIPAQQTSAQQATAQQIANGLSNNIQNENNKDDNQKQQEQRIAFIRRVTAAMQSAAQQNGIIKIRMHPETLGSVMLKAKMKENRITAHLFVESEEAKRLLLDNISDLESNLSKQGVTIEEFKVQVISAT